MDSNGEISKINTCAQMFSVVLCCLIIILMVNFVELRLYLALSLFNSIGVIN